GHRRAHQQHRAGCYGRNRANVWDYAGVNSLPQGRLEELNMHPTVKPVALVADAIKDCSKSHGIILDAFAGSGTTLIAADQPGRRGFALEIEPKYVDAALGDLQRRGGDPPRDRLALRRSGASARARRTSQRGGGRCPVITTSA